MIDVGSVTELELEDGNIITSKDIPSYFTEPVGCLNNFCFLPKVTFSLVCLFSVASIMSWMPDQLE